MDDFSVKPGHPNLYGLVGSEANAIEPGKRMLSSMSPTFVYENGSLKMVLGTPGGSTIPTTVLQVILNVIDYDMPLDDAVAAGRFHEQYLPDAVFIENGALDPRVIDELLEMGHKLRIRRPIGNVQAVLIDGGKLEAVSDPRGVGRAVGH
jgi:gamma-glutamyltranspeptidase/glutathione hydrolase